MKTTVMVTHRQVGFHCWPDAPIERAYLRQVHRHLFLIIASVHVHHDNRDVEFHDLQDMVRDHYQEVHDFKSQSCETIARRLGDSLRVKHNLPVAWVEVWEDAEVGARVEFA